MCPKKILVLFLACIICFVHHSVAQDTKEITCTGKVVDTQGKPVNDAKVQLYRVTDVCGEVEIELVEELTNNEDGFFTIKTEAGESELSNYAFILVKKEGLAMGWAYWNSHENSEVKIQLSRAKILAGIVMDEAQKPVANADVGIAFMKVQTNKRPQYLIGKMSLEVLMVKTNLEGKFSFGDIPAEATAELFVQKPGRATVNTYDPRSQWDGTLQFSAGQTDIKIVQPVESKIEGIVVEKTTGKPVEDVKLRIKRESRRLNIGQKPFVSKKDGSFVIDALAAGKHILQLVPYPEGLAEWVAKPVEVTTEAGKIKGGVKVELIKGGILEVAVTRAANKQPVEKASVHVLPQGSNTTISTLTDLDGIARFRVLPGKHHVVDIYKQGYSSSGQEGTIEVETSKIKRVEFQLKNQHKITGVVRDQKGELIEGAEIIVYPDSEGTFRSGADGKYEILWYPGRRLDGQVSYLVCRCEKDNLASAVEINEDIKVVNFKLEPGLIVAGKVVDPNGTAIEGVSVHVYLQVSEDNSPIGQNITKTDKEGIYEVKAIPIIEEMYYVRAQAEGFGRKNQEIDIYSAVNNRLEVEPLTLEAANLSVSGVVVDVNGVPVADVWIYCYGDNLPSRVVKTDADGKFTLEKLCAGEVNITVSKDGKVQLRGGAKTKGGATDVQIVVSEISSSSSSLRRRVPKQPSSFVGKSLPELKEFGIELSPADTNDTMILVCFWDMEQRPSRRFILELNKQAEELKQKGVTIVAVQASKINENVLSEWVEKNKISFPVGMIQSEIEKTKFAWGVRALPWLILTDNKHLVVTEGISLSELNNRFKNLEMNHAD